MTNLDDLVPEDIVLQFVVDHVQRRSAEGELAWELPPAVGQALVAAPCE